MHKALLQYIYREPPRYREKLIERPSSDFNCLFHYFDRCKASKNASLFSMSNFYLSEIDDLSRLCFFRVPILYIHTKNLFNASSGISSSHSLGERRGFEILTSEILWRKYTTCHMFRSKRVFQDSTRFYRILEPNGILACVRHVADINVSRA